MAKRAAAKDAAQTPPKRARRQSERVKTRKDEPEKKKEARTAITQRRGAAKDRKSASKQASKEVVVRSRAEDSIEPQSTSDSESSVIYIGHVPHGFYERQMREYFGQFGDVNKVKVSRSKSTGKSKGYAFVEFADPEVAKIAAETMHDYLMLGQKLVCNVVPLEELHPHTFKGANQRFKKIPWRKIESERHNKERTQKQESKRLGKLRSKDAKRQKRIEEAGINYEFDGHAASGGGKAKRAVGTKRKGATKPAVATKARKTGAAAKPKPTATPKAAAKTKAAPKSTATPKAAAKTKTAAKTKATPKAKAAPKEKLPSISPNLKTRSKTKAKVPTISPNLKTRSKTRAARSKAGK